MIAILSIAAAFLFALAFAFRPAPRSILIPIPRTFRGFLRSPLPLIAHDVRIGRSEATVANVYNHAAVKARLDASERME